MNNLNKIIEVLKENEVEVTVREIAKNNQTLTGLIITGYKGNPVTVAPTFYLENLEDRIAVEDFNDVICNMLSQIEWAVNNAPVSENFSVKEILNPERIVGQLISTTNKELLEKNMNREICDGLALIYRSVVCQDENGFASTYIPKTCGISEEELYKNAIKNMSKTKTLKCMSEFLAEMMEFDMPMPELTPEEDMTIVSNENKYLGAASILIPDVVDDLVKRYGGEDKFVILPSSIHEVLASPIREGMTVHDYESMVSDVNSTEVDIAEKLSDNVYRISGGKLERYVA